MGDFWIAFFGGLASGVVLAILSIIIRRLFRRQSEAKTFKLTRKEFRGLLIVAIALVLIFVDMFVFSGKGLLTGVGVALLAWGIVEFTS
jgi:drug/metabolite transporter (DMT)-like permease